MGRKDEIRRRIETPSPGTKKEITRTRNRNVLDPERRAAFRMADIDWNR